MTAQIYAVYGVSGCGRGVMPFARRKLNADCVPGSRLVFIDDNSSVSIINGMPVLTYEEFISTAATKRYAVIAVANSNTREQLADRCKFDGVFPWTVSADNVVIMDDVKLGAGAILSPFVTITSNVRIGCHFHANLYSYIEHDCVIGDFVTFAPSVKCNGNIVIEDHAYIGAGAVIRQGRPGEPLVIGRRSIVGMGAVVTRSVPAGTTVVGNPARPLVKN